jgi:hypothetical protein
MQAVTTVNAVKASKTLMRKPTQRHHGEGRRRQFAKPASSPVNDKDLAVPPGYWRQHACKEISINTGSPSDEGATVPQPAACEGMSRVAWDDGEVRSTDGQSQTLSVKRVTTAEGRDLS